MTIGGVATTKETHHDRSHPGRALKPALVSARPPVCHRFVGANSETGFGGEETSPSRSRRNAKRQSLCPALPRMCDSRPRRGTIKRDENLELHFCSRPDSIQSFRVLPPFALLAE